MEEKLKSKDVSLWLGGHSAEGANFKWINNFTYTVVINHGFIKHADDMDAMFFLDNDVADDFLGFSKGYKPKFKIYAAHGAFKKQQPLPIFNMVDQFLKKESHSGNFTATWAINYFRTRYPSKKLYIFGLDLMGEGHWYDKYINNIRKIKVVWEINAPEIDPKDPMYKYHSKGRKKAKALYNDLNYFLGDEKIINCSLNSRFDGFEKKDWRAVWPY